MKTKFTLMALLASMAFCAQNNPDDLMPLKSPSTPKSGTPPKIDVPRIEDEPKIDVPRLNDADDDLLEVKSKAKTDDLLPLKSEKASSSSTSRTDPTKDGVNNTLVIKNKGNQTTQPQRDKQTLGVIKETNNNGLINPKREKDDAPKDGFTKVKGNGTLTQPNTANENATNEIKPARTASNPNGGDFKTKTGTVVNENNPLQKNKSVETSVSKNPKDALGNKPNADAINANNKPTVEQLKAKGKETDLIKSIDKNPTNNRPKLETKNQKLPVGEEKVKDEKVKD